MRGRERGAGAGQAWGVTRRPRGVVQEAASERSSALAPHSPARQGRGRSAAVMLGAERERMLARRQAGTRRQAGKKKAGCIAADSR